MSGWLWPIRWFRWLMKISGMVQTYKKWPPFQSHDITVIVQYVTTSNIIWNPGTLIIHSCVFAVKFVLLVRPAVQHKAQTARLSPVYIYDNFKELIPKIYAIKICPCYRIRYVRKHLIFIPYEPIHSWICMRCSNRTTLTLFMYTVLQHAVHQFHASSIRVVRTDDWEVLLSSHCGV